MYILHVGDFHAHDPHGDTELLRLGFYEEYLERLHRSAMRCIPSGSVDMIVATGDFVNRGNIANFEHAASILSYLAKLFGVSAASVFVAAGNHDIVREHDAKGDRDSARAAFEAFAAQYGNAATTEANKFARLCRAPSDMWVLLLDATWGADGENRPSGEISTAVSDQVVGWVRSNTPRDAPLIVAAHYPVLPGGVPPHAAWAARDVDWHKHHLWHAATAMVDRLLRARPGGKTVLLYGDIHEQYDISYEVDGATEILLASGRFGTCMPKEDSFVRRQANILSVGDRDELLILEWDTGTHEPQTQMGEWRARDGGFRSFRQAYTTTRGIAAAITEAGPDIEIDQQAQTDEVTHERRGAEVKVLDPELQSTLLMTIRDRSLYHLGRFATHPEEVTLGWVTIGPLLNYGANLVEVIYAMGKWIGERIARRGGASATILIGMDAWGASLATQLGVLTGCYSFCVGTRGADANYAMNELVTQGLYERVGTSQNVIFVTDAIGSGRSIKRLQARLTDNMPQASIDSVDWSAVSVICDIKQEPRDLPFLSEIVTCCGALRIPRVDPSSLPDELILPPTLTF